MLDVLKELGYEKNGSWNLYPVTFRWIDWESGNELEYHEIELNGEWNEFYRLVEKRLEIAKITKDQKIESLYWPHVMSKKQLTDFLLCDIIALSIKQKELHETR